MADVDASRLPKYVTESSISSSVDDWVRTVSLDRYRSRPAELAYVPLPEPGLFLRGDVIGQGAQFDGCVPREHRDAGEQLGGAQRDRCGEAPRSYSAPFMC